jgi:hypothetical protein
MDRIRKGRGKKVRSPEVAVGRGGRFEVKEGRRWDRKILYRSRVEGRGL